jgi:hypothetical protein
MRVDAKDSQARQCVCGPAKIDTDTALVPAATDGRGPTRTGTPRPMPDSCSIGRWYRWGRGSWSAEAGVGGVCAPSGVTHLDLGDKWMFPLSLLLHVVFIRMPVVTDPRL